MKRRILGKRRSSRHCSLKLKKGNKRCRFDGTVRHLLSLYTQRQGKKRFVPLLLSLSLYLRKTQNRQDPHPLACHDEKAEETSPAGEAT